jgi:hypothetical protein
MLYARTATCGSRDPPHTDKVTHTHVDGVDGVDGVDRGSWIFDLILEPIAKSGTHIMIAEPACK